MRRRRALFTLIALGVAGILYIASPFWSAWGLREAVRRGDIGALESGVDWPKVRASLRESLSQHPHLLPQAITAGEEVKPTLWQRVKGAFGATMLDRFIESYVTPEGLPKLYTYRKLWNEQVRDRPDEAKTQAWHERFAGFLARVKRAEFQSLGRVEIEVEDRLAPERRYVSTLEFAGLGWKLVGMRVKVADRATAGSQTIHP